MNYNYAKELAAAVLNMGDLISVMYVVGGVLREWRGVMTWL